MKISLGIDFNKKRTIVSYFNTENNKIETLYNEPSIGIISKTGGQAYYGNQCNQVHSLGHNYDYVESFLNENSDRVADYLKYVLDVSISKLKTDNLIVEYIVFVDNKKASEIKKAIFPSLRETLKYQKSFYSTKLIFSKRNELLKLSLIKELNKENEITEEKIMLIDLSNFIYQVDVFDYKTSQVIPAKASYSQKQEFNGMGINGFVEKMYKNMQERGAFSDNRRAFETGLIKDQFLQKLTKLIAEKPLTFYENAMVPISIIVNNKEVGINVKKEDYDFAVAEAIYSNESLRSFLKAKRIPDYCKTKNCKVILYGLLENVVDAKALIYSMFGEDYISNEKILKYDNILNLTHVSEGACIQTTLRYKGLAPKISYKMYDDRIKKILLGNEELILSRSINDRATYFDYRDFNIPLLYNNDKRIIFNVNGNDIDITERLYDHSGLILNSNAKKIGDGFIANLRIGVYDEGSKLLILDFSSPENNYSQSVELEVL